MSSLTAKEADRIAKMVEEHHWKVALGKHRTVTKVLRSLDRHFDAEDGYLILRALERAHRKRAERRKNQYRALSKEFHAK